MRLRFIEAFNTNSFQLDIVGFLAILGEGSLDPIAQVATLSSFVYLPRLLPAPQVFIRPARPEKLESTANATVIGIKSGNSSANIHHVAHALHRGDKMAQNSVKLVRVSEDTEKDRPSIRVLGPLTWLALIGFSMSALLFGLSFHYEDGMALLATILLSLLSTTTGVANKWKPTENQPGIDPNSPPGDVVIRYPQGAFIVVQCHEVTARYLYYNPSERCIYQVGSGVAYRGLSLVSTLLLMGGVICLANARIELQTGFAAAYMIINIVYWIGAALPPAQHWNLTRLLITEIDIKGGCPPRQAGMEQSYTEALWKAIAVTRNKEWIKEAGWAPKTETWDTWLERAENKAKKSKIVETTDQRDGKDVEVWEIETWDAKGELSILLKPNNENQSRV